MSPLLDPPRTEKSARTRLDTKATPGAFRGTDGSNPVPSSGESGTNSVQGVPHNRSVMFWNGSTAIDGLSGSPLCLPSGRAPMICLPATATPGELSPTVTILLFLRLPAISMESLSRLLRRRVV
jgi:hypothetical protein